MDGTTAIKIDYYEELKAKADKYDNAKVIIDFTNGICYTHEEKSKNFVLPIVRYDDFVKLREKADKWDEKETPFKPTTLRSNEFGDILGKCKCRATVLIDENYCNKCSQRLDWTES